MKRLLLAVFLVSLTAFSPAEQQQDELTCQGYFMGQRATVKGQIGYVNGRYFRFVGTLRSASFSARMIYEDYRNLAPYEGELRTPQGVIPIEVLDATGANGNEMIIYERDPTSYTSNKLGTFICIWR